MHMNLAAINTKTNWKIIMQIKDESFVILTL